MEKPIIQSSHHGNHKQPQGLWETLVCKSPPAPMLLCSLHKMRNFQECKFFFLTFCHYVFSLHLSSHQGNIHIFSLSDLRIKKKQICCRRLSSVLLPHPSLTTKRRKRDACSERFVWRRCRVWPHVPGRLIGCAPLPPGASEPAGWGSSRPSVPGSGSAPGDKQVSSCMKRRHAETMRCKWDVR